MFMGLAGATYNTMKDFMLGRAVDLGENFWDGVLQMGATNRYLLNKGGREGYLGSFIRSQFPPLTKVLDDFGTDVIKTSTGKRDIKDWRTVTNLPYGKMFYWWFGGGKDKRTKPKKKSKKKSLKASDIL